MTPVFVVHCIDTEGPLYESLEAKFDRIAELLGVSTVTPTWENLRKLQAGEIDLGGNEKAVSSILSSHRSNTMATWDQLDAMLDMVMSKAFRCKSLDSRGGGWVYNWFCLDHVGYDTNPRRRDIGHHNIFDHYRSRLAVAPEQGDELQWHFHPMSTYREAHRCATHYLRTDHVYQILSRKIIDRAWFPSAFRAGFQAERPDSHWLLEQFVPFDMTNMAVEDISQFDRARDFRNGRSGDWRRAPSDWSIYHPSHDDYQKPGNCRRWIARCLNIMSRVASIDQREVDKAFRHAAEGKPTILGICSHDYRHLGPEVDHVRDLLSSAQQRYPSVPIRYAGVREAFREALSLRCEAPLELGLELIPASPYDVASVTIKTLAGKVFGPQPFLAIKTRGGRYIHDNLDFAMDGRSWHYAFHEDTLPLTDVECIGVGASDAFGNASVVTIKPN